MGMHQNKYTLLYISSWSSRFSFSTKFPTTKDNLSHGNFLQKHQFLYKIIFYQYGQLLRRSSWVVRFDYAMDNFLQLNSFEQHSLKKKIPANELFVMQGEKSGHNLILCKRINCFVLILKNDLAIKTNELQLHISILINLKSLMISKKTKLFIQMLKH